MRALAILAVACLAGCAQPGPWHEDWRILIDGEVDSWHAEIPIWEGVGQDLRVVRGNGSFEVQPCGSGECVVVTGSGTVDLEAHRSVCCGDGYLAPGWPGERIADGRAITVDTTGVFSVSVRVSAVGPECWREAAFQGYALEDGAWPLEGSDNACR